MNVVTRILVHAVVILACTSVCNGDYGPLKIYALQECTSKYDCFNGNYQNGYCDKWPQWTECSQGYYTGFNQCIFFYSSPCSKCPLTTPPTCWGGSSCIYPPPGYYADGLFGMCRSCIGEAGVYCPGGPNSHIACTANNYCPGTEGNTFAPIPCPLGTWTNDLMGKSTCVSCPTQYPNSVFVASRCELACKAGYAGVSAYTCAACLPGRYVSTTGATACLACAAGSSSSSAGASGCAGCAAGTYAPSSGLSACYACPGGTYSGTAGQTACAACSVGAAMLPGMSACLYCPAGTYVASPSQSCAGCAIGSYCALGVSTPCPAGLFSNATNSSSCTACAVKTYSPTVGSTACLACPVGTFCPPGSSAPAQCAALPSQYAYFIGLATSLPCPYLCNVGYSLPACSACPANYFCPNSTALPCPAGTTTMGATGAGSYVDCVCAPGTFGSTTGPTTASCTACPQNSFCDGTAPACTCSSAGRR